MIDPVASIRIATGVVLALAAGASLLACLDPRFSERPRLRALAYITAAILAAAQLALLVRPSGAGVAGELAHAAVNFATASWTGRVLLLRIAVAAASAAAMGLPIGARCRAGLAIAVANLALLPLSGHAASAPPFLLSVLFHAAHVAAALLWFGGLVWLAWSAIAGGTPSRVEALVSNLRLFSPVALRLVVIAAGTGIVAAALQLQRPAALFGTAYGQLVLVKAFLLLPIALACAAALRFGFVRLARGRSPLVILLVEIAAVFGLCVVAAILSQGVPGRHDDIVWPFGFRLDPSRLWTVPQYAQVSLTLLAFGGILAAVAGYLAWRREWPRAIFCACGAALVPLFSIVQVAVPATPASYAQSSSRYAVPNLASAASLYRKQCAYCHGETGRGDGPVIAQLEFANADLTAAHTLDHTSGDLFWWITHGTPSGQMPDFENDIDDDGRWDLVNYVRYLTAARRSSALGTDVEPGRPWLPAIDFDYLDSSGTLLSLHDSEPTTSVLLVLGRAPASLDRLKALRDGEAMLAKAGVVVFFVCGPEIAAECRQETADPTLKVLSTNVDDLVWAWAGYSGTNGPTSESPVGHLEFLIDRFGYVRARWRGDQQALAAVDAIIAQSRMLAAERELLPPPDQHAH